MQLSQVLLSQVGFRSLTVPRDGVHIFLLGGFWDTTKPETAHEFLLLAEGNTSMRGTFCLETFFTLPELFCFFGDYLPLVRFNFFDANAPFTLGLLGAILHPACHVDLFLFSSDGAPNLTKGAFDGMTWELFCPLEISLSCWCVDSLSLWPYTEVSGDNWEIASIFSASIPGSSLIRSSSSHPWQRQ